MCDFPENDISSEKKMSLFRKIAVERLTVNFKEATRVISVAFPDTLRRTEVLVKNKFLGVNASDINFSAGIYLPDVKVPFDCGFEALGTVVSVGSAVKDYKPGDTVVTQSFGSFAEYQVVPHRHVFSVPTLDKEWLPLGLSGVTASIAIEHVLKPMKGDRAVVTAAAGATGHFALQLLHKKYGCTVVGTCSSEEKAQFIVGKLRCPRPIVVSSERSLCLALKAIFPQGVHLAYESVGGTTLDDVVDSLTLRGKVLSIGSTSCYQDGSVEKSLPANRKTLPLRLLSKSASLHTFFLPHYAKHIPSHLAQLCKLVDDGVITSGVDPTPFHGLESVYDAIDFMYGRKNSGKIVVEL